ncbi:MAG: aminodeoxychorismate synthase component I [Planctomycetes bacterium]|nr:aminodeoxychorismate synthase component I [Planctomycetota bacterium]
MAKVLSAASKGRVGTALAQAVIEPLARRVHPEAALLAFAAGPAPAVLETTLPAPNAPAYSIFAAQSRDELIVSTGQVGCPVAALSACVARYPTMEPPRTDLPFTGGWIGYFSYEAGRAIEPAATRPPAPASGSNGRGGTGNRAPAGAEAARTPLAHFRLYDSAAVYDHAADAWYAVAVDWPADAPMPRAPVKDRLTSVGERLARVADWQPQAPPRPDVPTPTVNMTRRAYLARVAQALEYIRAGDIYQVNLARRYTVARASDPLTTYRRLRRVNPAPYSAYIATGDGAVLSASPELFLELRAGHVVTRPIKGTRPRGEEAQSDATHRAALEASDKDRAELNMIVDLLRNDLGRVCRAGSVRVVDAGAVESHPTVFHRVATIEGDLAPGRDWCDLLRASFPGGSITGAPKIRAMQIIDELEPSPRGVYCGSIGYIGVDGSMVLNVAIRTMTQARDTVRLHAGGAIVAGSLAEEELAETQAKAAGMLRALGCDEADATTVED